jgi:hypothetical protein
MPRPVRAISFLLVCVPLVALLAPRGAETIPVYAARNGLACGTCHFDPNGGGPRNDFGFAFAKKRHSMEEEPEGSPWKDLNLTNKIGETMPVYLGVNQRFMLFTNTTAKNDSLDRLGYFGMESALHITFQPHPRLTLVYSNDVFASASNIVTPRQRDAYGKISGFPLDGYMKVGRFRVPFGLRMDDHTVATRVGFLDFANGKTFLPYDPRLPDMGIEIGGESRGVFGRAAYTDGRANVLNQDPYAETTTLKLGYRQSRFEMAASLYDDFAKTPPSGSLNPAKRLTRWGWYGFTHWQSWALLGEVAAGTDEAQPAAGFASGDKTNLLAGWGEIDYAPTRSTNLRTRYDYMVTDRSSDPAIRDDNTFSRWALEGEWVPVPFAELRLALRHIDYKENQGPLGVDNENQAFLQAHFSY